MEDAASANGSIPEFIPRLAMCVARRSLILSAVVCRGSIESGPTDPDAISLHRRIQDWLTQLNLWDEAEPSEQTMLRAPLGTLNAKDVIQATWHIEGLAILAWALKLLELPPQWEQVDTYLVTDALWFLDETAEDRVINAELRSPAELEACRELLYAIHSRLRDFTRYKDQKNITHWIEKSWLDALGLKAADLMVHNDLAIDGKAISEVDADRLQECNSIISERHRAIIWLVEGSESYSQTTADT